MKLNIIEKMSPEKWDNEISQFETKFLFHQSVWLEFLEATQPGRLIRLKITEKNQIIGFFTGIIVNKGPFNILGSPLTGWTTEYMGPIVHNDFDWEKFFSILNDFCQNLKIHHIELCNPFLDHDLMLNSGFSDSEGITYLVPLTQDEQKMWGDLKSACRNRIRKGLKNELVVENCNDPAFADEYYRQLIEVFARQKLVPTYPIERVKNLYKNLKPDFLFTLKVKHNGQSVATGIFPCDNRCVYFFGGASYLKSYKLFPNELLHWTAMNLAAQKGIPQYDMCGNGSGTFKSKFGGKMVSVHRYYKNYSALASIGRKTYKLIFQAKQRIRGRLTKNSI